MFRTLATSSLALTALAAPALSDISPAELWDQMVAQSASVGVTLTEGKRDEAGDTLTITDAVFSSKAPTGSTTVNMPKVVLNQTGDGNVRWTVDGDITGTTTFTPPDEETLTTTFKMSLEGDEIVSSGSVDDLTHEYRADTAAMEFEFPIPEAEGEPVTLNLVMTGLTGKEHSVATDGEMGRKVDSESSAETLTATFAGTGPEGTFNGDYTVNQLDIAATVAVPAQKFDLETQMEEALRAGFDVAFDMKIGDGKGAFQFSGVDEDGVEQDGDGIFTAGASTLTFSMSDEGLRYAATGGAGEATISSAEMPFPISYSMDSAAFDFSIPLLSSEEPSPFAFVAATKGLTINEELWSMFDPSEQLPRDPADLVIDLSGELVMSKSVLDAATEDMDDPFERVQPRSVTINDVTLKAVGAEANVTGELSVPEGGMITAPVGTVKGEFTGVNALLDTLANMGLIAEDEMMPARMMLAMFAKPVDGDANKLMTELEFHEDGSVFANGQQVK